MNAALKGSSYETVIFNTHGYSNGRGIVLKHVKGNDDNIEDLNPTELKEAFENAKSTPRRLYFYGCDTAKTGFAKEVSGRFGPGTEVTGTSDILKGDVTWRGKNFHINEDRKYNVRYSDGQETYNARKIDINSATIPR